MVNAENASPWKPSRQGYECTRGAEFSRYLEDLADTRFLKSTLVRGSTALLATDEKVYASSLNTRRKREVFTEANPENYLFASIRSGSAAVCQLGRETVARTGDLVAIDTSNPFRIWYGDGTQDLLVVSKRLLPLPPSQVNRLLARRLTADEGIGSVLVRCLHELAQEGDRYRPAELHRILDIAVDLLATLLIHELDTLSSLPPASPEQALLTLVDAFVRENLGDPGLTPKAIAAAHHVSLRRLQQVLAADGTTPAALIRNRRLERCRRALADLRQRERPVHAVAARWGFPDHAHFSRLFKSTYGVSPSEYRASFEPLVRG
ncbi:helix-turn-helix domain-containing protein [Streptomyces sp. NPDC058953]|uniref:helix-turn-helix domain-containing protein n=1 Tax=unclassified Streptomyces TaxID=2593676 RepID=UPI003680BA30